MIKSRRRTGSETWRRTSESCASHRLAWRWPATSTIPTALPRQDHPTNRKPPGSQRHRRELGIERTDPVQTPVRASRNTTRDFRPSLRSRRTSDGPDPMSIDPTLRLDLLAKLRDVQVDGVTRNLFEFSKAPLPKAPEPKILPKPVNTPKPSAAKPAKPRTVKPPPPPINLKFYGYISQARSSAKRAFFLDGEDIFVAGEGDIIQKRYKVVSIGNNSAVVEDTEHDNQQTLTLVEQRG